jgi:ABC-type nitrate/sulfonate/bicarbonate transport system permease component
MRLRWPGFVLVLAALVVWECASLLGWVDAVSVPRVSTILGALLREVTSGTLLAQLGPSLRRILIGLGLACAIGVPLGLLMGVNRFAYRLLEPVTELIRPIPSAAYIPVAILFLGLGDQMKLFVITLAGVFPVLLNTYSGVQGVDPVLIDTGRTLGTPRLSILRKIVLPASLPSILTGVRISLGIALIVSVVAEMISGTNGLGYFIIDKQRSFRVPEVFAGILALGLLGYALNLVFLQLERYVLRWRTTTVEA